MSRGPDKPHSPRPGKQGFERREGGPKADNRPGGRPAVTAPGPPRGPLPGGPDRGRGFKRVPDAPGFEVRRDERNPGRPDGRPDSRPGTAPAALDGRPGAPDRGRGFKRPSTHRFREAQDEKIPTAVPMAAPAVTARGRPSGPIADAAFKRPPGAPGFEVRRTEIPIARQPPIAAPTPAPAPRRGRGFKRPSDALEVRRDERNPDSRPDGRPGDRPSGRPDSRPGAAGSRTRFQAPPDAPGFEGAQKKPDSRPDNRPGGRPGGNRPGARIADAASSARPMHPALRCAGTKEIPSRSRQPPRWPSRQPSRWSALVAAAQRPPRQPPRRSDRGRGFKRPPGAPGLRRSDPQPPKTLGPDARRIALDALIEVTASGAFSTLALDAGLRKSRIDPLDKRLATNIFYTALENQIRLEYALSQFVERMPDRQTKCVLLIAAAQLLLMDKIPDYATVDAAANQARAIERSQYVPLVNGALRSLIRARDGGALNWPDRTDPLKYLSVMHSLPEPLAARLIADWGLDEAERIIAYRPGARVATVRPNLTRMDAARFEDYGQEKGWRLEKASVPNAYHLPRPGDLAGDPDFKMGLFTIQGEGSMLAALALEPKRAGNYLDACAAPGGKSALIAEIMQQTGRVQAWDVHPHRVELIQTTKKRLRLDNLRAVERDASVPRPDLEGVFDGVLIDAPCSGLGVMHDKPDIKYRVTEEDLAALVALQARILDACAPFVAPGGLLVYATCTVLKDENERQVRAFLARHPQYEPEPSAAFLPERLRAGYQDGMIQLQAYAWNAEGFFIARMRRRRP